MSKLASLAVAVVMACAVAPAAGQQLTYSWPTNVGPLNPHLYAPNQMFAQASVYEPLVRYRADGTIEPWLATAWTVSPDGRTYDFILRPGVTFSDGTPFDAAAVKANFDAILANRARHEWLDLTRQIDRAEIAGPLAFRLVLKAPHDPTLRELALPRPFRFLSPAAMGEGGTTASGIKAPVGTGPWRLVETRLGISDTFAANPTYWGGKPAFARLVVKVIPDPNTRAIALQTGEIDLVYGAAGQIPSEAFLRLRDQAPAVSGAVSAPLATRVLALNSARAPTDDRAVRLAINRAVDKDTLVRTVLDGLEPRADFLFAPSVPDADAGLTPHGFDRAAANRLLDEAGWARGTDGMRAKGGRPLAVELDFVGTNAQQKAIAEVIQADLARIGIAVRLVGEEESAILARQKDGRFGLIFGETWGPPYDPASFLSAMRAPSHADYQAQRGLPEKPEIDATITAILAAADPAERKRLTAGLLTALHESAVYLPISHAVAIEVHRSAIAGVGFGATLNEIPFAAMRPASDRADR
ncbi:MULTISPECIES: nickel ABC transporter substrate-binding protein [Methylobacterium]|uniref:nickel ABC transporter substrate-binding protein n=1 Tax=Methylobacterium TaxID=407 RepID=UPI0013EA1FDE|nr:nickel ABC transporter substrate-binding protein [Methylobacterium sp. DB0501]NGM35487.1 nickel ABC transporter, nickel/metallophore periplasmic binding protein [Methylobacterium sp. DB0501]